MKVKTACMLRWCLFTPLFMWKIQVISLWTVTERKDRKVCKLDGELKILFKKKINIVNQINKHRSSSRLVKEISTITKILPRGNRSYFGFAWCQFLLLLLFQFSVQGLCIQARTGIFQMDIYDSPHKSNAWIHHSGLWRVWSTFEYSSRLFLLLTIAASSIYKRCM